jgi:hypothetical protein
MHHVVFARLPWGEGTLEEHAPVVWSLDIPPPEPRAPGGWPVMVFTDPDHQFARVRDRFESLRQVVADRWGGLAATLGDLVGSTWGLRWLAPVASPLVILGHNSAIDELHDIDNPACSAATGTTAPKGSTPRNPGLLEDAESPPPGILIGETAAGLETMVLLDPPREAILESCASGPADALSLASGVGPGHALVAAGAGQVMVTRALICPGSSFELTAALLKTLDPGSIDLSTSLSTVRATHDPNYLRRVLIP